MQKFQYPQRPLTKANSQFQLRIKADIAEFLPAADAGYTALRQSHEPIVSRALRRDHLFRLLAYGSNWRIGHRLSLI
jgi:hypothetical protein